ncbi:hypothetical protein AB1Y20_009680 [Prymnesium parvum]|uniref:SSD domain-containing protein n=1 Tax=Prymnesium parvum TaxID=97485 RepID=A0AB34K5Q7_PRYPA
MSSCQAKLSASVQSWFYSVFYKWGLIVAKSPKKVIAISLFLAFLFSLRLLMAPSQPLPTETRQEKLFAPQDSQGVEDYERYRDTFGYGSRRNTVYITTQPHGGNVLTSSVLAEALRFDSIVRNELYMYQFEYDSKWTEKKNYTFSDICVRGTTNSLCLNNQYPLELFQWANGSFSFGFTDAEILDIVNSRKGIDPELFPPAANRTVSVESVFGGIQRDATTGRITSAASMQLVYTIVEGDRDDFVETRSFAWEEQLNYFVAPEWTDDPPEGTRGAAYPDKVFSWSSTIIDVYPNTAGAIGREFSNAVRGDLTGLQIGLMSICAYSFFILIRCRTPMRSRASLTAAGIASCGIAIAIAYSMGSLVEPINQVINVLPFVLIGIGVDDMFVLISSLEAIPMDLPVDERIAMGMASAGVSITITSLTDFLAFLLGSSSSLPGLAAFCIYAAIGILADFVLQITFFAGWMVLDAQREANQRSDCCCCPCAPKAPVKEGDGCFKFYPQLQDLNKKYYIPFLRNPIVKVVVLVSFISFAGIAAWQASQLEQNFDRRWFVDSDAQLQQAFEISDLYYRDTSDGVSFNVATPSSVHFDYTLAESQQKLITLSAAVASNEWVRDASVVPWYQPLRAWVYSCISTHSVSDGTSTFTCIGRSCAVNGVLLFPHCTRQKNIRDASGNLVLDANGAPIPQGVDNKTMILIDGTTAPDDTPVANTYLPPSSFYVYLDQFLYDSAAGSRYTSYIIWKVPNVGNLSFIEVNQGLEAAQFRASHVYMDKASNQIDAMRTLRDDVESAGVGEGKESYPFTFVYIFFEQFAIIGQEAFVNLALALTAVFIIVTLLIGSFHASFMVIVCVVLVDIDILGLMRMWGLGIDSVTIINLVLAVGLAVDYSAHLTHAFVVAKGTRQERTEIALEEMGTAVVHGAMSTFAAVLILSTSQSYIFRVFFKQFFGICIFGAAHGLCFLPVLLSFVGPEPIEVNKAKSSLEMKTAQPGEKQVEVIA